MGGKKDRKRKHREAERKIQRVFPGQSAMWQPQQSNRPASKTYRSWGQPSSTPWWNHRHTRRSHTHTHTHTIQSLTTTLNLNHPWTALCLTTCCENGGRTCDGILNSMLACKEKKLGIHGGKKRLSTLNQIFLSQLLAIKSSSSRHNFCRKIIMTSDLCYTWQVQVHSCRSVVQTHSVPNNNSIW